MAISRYKDNRDKEFEHENVISLKHFPYKLRKAADQGDEGAQKALDELNKQGN